MSDLSCSNHIYKIYDLNNNNYNDNIIIFIIVTIDKIVNISK